MAVNERFPKMIVFDLDGTIWNPEMYELWSGGGSPFKKNQKLNVIDRSGTEVELIADVRPIFDLITSDAKYSNVKIAIASRTDEPSWAEECLQKIEIKSGLALKRAFHLEEIHKANKKIHFQNLHKQTGIAYEDMIFWDNEYSNIVDVGHLGVHCVYCPAGVTWSLWNKSLEEFGKPKKTKTK